jgi:polyphosphate kinase
MRADFLNVPSHVVPDKHAASFDLSGPERFFNRELSWLAFNWRVLEEAGDPHQPVLERLRFLSISGTNLDEFYTVRVAGLRAQVRAGVETLSADGRTPAQQLELVDRNSLALQSAQQTTWAKLRQDLTAEGILVVAPADLTESDRGMLDQYFLDQVFPMITRETIRRVSIQITIFCVLE